jgi:hypothetical protein
MDACLVYIMHGGQKISGVWRHEFVILVWKNVEVNGAEHPILTFIVTEMYGAEGV